MKTRLMSLLAIICLAFSFTSFGQEQATQNTITRTTCPISGNGCYDGGTVTLKMISTSSGTGGLASTNSYLAGDTKQHLALCKYIKVTIGATGYTNSAPLPALPTVINDVVTIDVYNTSMTDEYTVYIKKIADKQFTMSVAHNVL
ncbi:hypothetical protein F0919_06230 [Taibaiella lutea]|uniref:Uncharacterized protein n=1 Tax=Taibaiella lutea TaxID=2608001 RepID=A0A5M6CQM9_9BACT|nr:hypothetical protein [Taibaiella lutea]KAA5537266.1 hypothetical protein F0919_06230 [Taibaiella lutea]